MKLDLLRSELSAVDRRLLELIAERQRLVGEIGRSKQSSGAGTRDYAREKEVLSMGRAQAEHLGIDPDLAENILRQLIRSSLASQATIAATSSVLAGLATQPGLLANLPRTSTR